MPSLRLEAEHLEAIAVHLDFASLLLFRLASSECRTAAAIALKLWIPEDINPAQLRLLLQRNPRLGALQLDVRQLGMLAALPPTAKRPRHIIIYPSATYHRYPGNARPVHFDNEQQCQAYLRGVSSFSAPYYNVTGATLASLGSVKWLRSLDLRLFEPYGSVARSHVLLLAQLTQLTSLVLPVFGDAGAKESRDQAALDVAADISSLRSFSMTDLPGEGGLVLDVEQLRGWDRLGHLHYLALCQVVAARAPADAASSQLASADAAAADAAAASSSASSAAGEGHWWSDGIAQLGELRGFSLSGAYDYVYGDYPWSSGGRSKCKLSVAQVAQLLQTAPHLRHLALRDIWGLGAGVLEAVAQHAAQLYSLDLTGSCRYADPEALQCLEHLQQLRELNLARWGSAGWCMHRREYEDPLTWAWDEQEWQEQAGEAGTQQQAANREWQQNQLQQQRLARRSLQRASPLQRRSLQRRSQLGLQRNSPVSDAQQGAQQQPASPKAGSGSGSGRGGLLKRLLKSMLWTAPRVLDEANAEAAAAAALPPPPPAWAQHLAKLSSLRALSLAFWKGLTPEAARALAEGLRNLERLSLAGVTVGLAPELFTCFTQISSLDLSRADEPYDASARMWSTGVLPKLRRLRYVQLNEVRLDSLEVKQLARLLPPGGLLVVEMGTYRHPSGAAAAGPETQEALVRLERSHRVLRWEQN